MTDLMNEVKVRPITSEKTSYICPYSRKKIKRIPVIIKQFKNIIKTNNSFLRARAYYVKETYLKKKKRISHCHIATTIKHKSYGMNLVVSEHRLTEL